MHKRFFLYFIFFLQAFACVSQAYRFKHITSEEGLPTNNVFTILQDSKGFMWFGTQEGLCKYDGYNITVFKHNPKSNSVSGSWINSLYEHKNGKLYIGTRNSGLSIYDPVKNLFETISNKGKKDEALSDEKVAVISAYDDEHLIVGTGHGLNLVNTQTKKVTRVLFPLTDPVNVSFIHKIGNKAIVGTEEKGLWVLTENFQLKPVNLENPFSIKIDNQKLKSFTCINEYSNKLYIGTSGEGILVVDPFSFEVEKVLKTKIINSQENFIKSIEIKNNKLFAGTFSGLSIFNLISGEYERFENDGDKKGLNDNKIETVFIDKEGNLWLGMFSGGVNVSFSQTQKFPNLPKSINSRFLQTFSLYEDSDHDLWVGGENYLKRFNRKSLNIDEYNNQLKETYVISLTGDNKGNIYAGTWGDAVLKIDKHTKKTEEILKKQIIGGTVISLCMDGDNLWVGTYGSGVFIYNTLSRNHTNFTLREKLADNITCFLKDNEGNMWIGTDGSGVFKIKNANPSDSKNIKKFIQDESDNCIPSDVIYSISQDENKNIWFATTFGISTYNPATGKFKNYTEEDGLANNFTYSVLADSAQNIWISSNKGLTKFNPGIANINGSAFKNYSQKDGLLNDEYTQNAFCKLASGEMVFGSINGINIFNPKKIQDNYHVPPVYIIAYKRAGKEIVTDTTILLKKKLKLNWRENFFQFEVVGLDYIDPPKNKYTFKLENYDEEWSSPTNVRYVSYTELSGGNYVFKVKASNNDGVWNEVPYEINIEVIPPFWKTKWFYVLVSLIGLLSVILFTRYRTKAIKKENKILEHKVEERTKELAEKNRDITSSIQYAKRIQEAILPTQQLIHQNFKQAFLIYKPKDIVSGDFYWFGVKNNFKILAVVDCTGHGVPGAFMSMIGHNLLNQIVIENEITDPGQILNNLHKGVQNALKQGQNEINTNDGMDVSLIAVNDTTGKVYWAGAFRPLVIVRENHELEKIDGNKYPVGGAQMDVNRIFTTHDVRLNKNDSVYMFSDGYADQFGGDKGKKFMLKRFHEILVKIHLEPMEFQKQELEKHFEDWKGGIHEQVDDVLVAAIRF